MLFFLFLFQIIIGLWVFINAKRTTYKEQPINRNSTYASLKLNKGKLLISQIPENERGNASTILNALVTGNLNLIIEEFKDIHNKRGGSDPVIKTLLGQLQSKISAK
jgi:hypothetical protein